MRKVACALWKGTDLPNFSNNAYGPRWVANLARNVKRHVPDGKLMVLADFFYEQELRKARETMPELNDVEIRALQGHDCGGWSNMLEFYRPDLRPLGSERYLAVGLDTVFVGDSTWLFYWNLSPIGLPWDPFHHSVPCDSVVSYNKEGAEIVWKHFVEAKERNQMKDFLLFGKPSEMVLLRHLFGLYNWQPLEREPEKLLSYKVHLSRQKKEWRGSSVVYFHGKPKPTDLRAEDPIRQEWERA